MFLNLPNVTYLSLRKVAFCIFNDKVTQFGFEENYITVRQSVI